MRIEDKEPKTATYGHHFHQYAEMIGAPNVHSVFEYLLDCYMSNIRTGKDGEFELSMSRISVCRRMNRATVKNSLNILEDMGLIKMNGSKCAINAARYASLIIAYVNLDKGEDRKTFQSMLSGGDYKGLEGLGYREVIGNEDVFLKQKGGSDLLNFEQVSNFKQVSNIEQMSNFKQADDSDLSNIEQVHDNTLYNFKHLSNIIQVDLLKIKQSYDTCLKLSTLLPAFDRSLMKQVVEVGVKNGLKEDILLKIKQVMPDIAEDEVFSICLDRYCSCDPDVFDDVTNPWVLNFDHLAAQFYTGGCLKLSTSNNINNKNKKEYLDERSESSNKGKKSKEANFEDEDYGNLTFNQKEGFKENLGEVSEEDNDDVNFQLEEENIQEVEVKEGRGEVEEDFDPAKRIALDNTTRKHLKRKETYNRLKITPFFPVNEIEDIIRNPKLCLERPDKLFIHLLYTILFESEIETDEDFEAGKETDAKDIMEKLEERHISERDLIDKYATQAYDGVQEAFEKGCFETETEELPVTFKEMLSPNDVDIILGFETYWNGGVKYYIISAKMIKDITRTITPDIERIEASEMSLIEKRRNDTAYLQKILYMGFDEVDYEKLTPVEKEIYRFMEHFFIVDFDKMDWEPNDKKQIIDSVNSSTILYKDLDYFMSQISGCTEGEFLGLTSMGKDRHGHYVISQKRVFFADKIRDLNALRGYKSVIDSFTLDYTIPD